MFNLTQTFSYGSLSVVSFITLAILTGLLHDLLCGGSGYFQRNVECFTTIGNRDPQLKSI